ncbi:hypothetical protein DFH27DRAFT_611180 [Peziza echinospora]|nr:hypothetical protein DFH27DRAFT_611180 [Peziza echinospora]
MDKYRGFRFPTARSVVYPEFEPTVVAEEMLSMSEMMGIPTMEPNGDGQLRPLNQPTRLWKYPGRHTPMPPPKRSSTGMDSNVLHQDKSPSTTEHGERSKRAWEIAKELEEAWQADLHVQDHEDPLTHNAAKIRYLNAHVQLQEGHEVMPLEQMPFNLSNMYREGSLSENMTYEQLMERLSNLYNVQKLFDEYKEREPVFLWNFDPKCLDSRTTHTKLKQRKPWPLRNNENDPLRIWRDAISRAAVVLQKADDNLFWESSTNKDDMTMFIDSAGAPNN